MTLPSLIGMDVEQLTDVAVGLGAPKFTGKQLAQWLYEKRVTDIDAMSNLSKDLRAKLATKYTTLTSRVIESQDSKEGTTKLAIRLHDGPIIEAVLMRESVAGKPDRLTACISTQAGCAMGCRFCASGKLGLNRSLAAHEILEQFYHLGALLLPTNEWLTNVVFMGMGEPLHNLDGLTGALTVMHSEWGFNMSARRITVSTVGLPDRMRALADFGIPIKLAVSLHGIDDESRSALIPTNAGIQNILASAQYYFETTGREVTFEYTLVGGQNDDIRTAYKLAELVRHFPRANVNLIPMNPVEGSGLNAPSIENVRKFAEVLEREQINVHERRRRGRRVQAACGQLRLRLEEATT